MVMASSQAMQPFKPADIFVSERRTEVFLQAVDPDDPNDPFFLGFIEPSVATNFLTPGTNRLADSDPDDPVNRLAGLIEGDRLDAAPDSVGSLRNIRLAQYDPGPDNRDTLVAVLGMIGYLVTVGGLLCS